MARVVHDLCFSCHVCGMRTSQHKEDGTCLRCGAIVIGDVAKTKSTYTALMFSPVLVMLALPAFMLLLWVVDTVKWWVVMLWR